LCVLNRDFISTGLLLSYLVRQPPTGNALRRSARHADHRVGKRARDASALHPTRTIRSTEPIDAIMAI